MSTTTKTTTTKPRRKGRPARPGPDKAALARVRKAFEAAGITPTEWAQARGFNPQTVTDLLNNRLRGHHGAAHRAAVALGLKKGLVADPATFNPSAMS